MRAISFHRARRGVGVRAAQLGRQQVPAAEDVERQVAVAVVIAVEEAAFLVAMQRIVGGIEIEDDLFGGLLVGVEEEIDEQAFDRRRVMADLVISRRLAAAQFQPVQRRFARQRRTVRSLRLQLAGQHGQHRVAPQFVVVVEVLVAERNADDALHHHGLDLVFHQLGSARVGEAGGKPLGQPDRPVGLAQQQGAGIRGDRPTVEARHDLAAFDRWKFEQRGATLCRHWGVLRIRENRGCNTILSESAPQCTRFGEKFGLSS